MKRILSSKWFGYPFILLLLVGDYSNQPLSSIVGHVGMALLMGLIVSLTAYIIRLFRKNKRPEGER
ncbi:hypothetical protein [Alkalihalobacillus sp. R86527]|uniref:hypothetical protein n=1 Tax=Alkalihalobacillus sp. R86527 TaxID=3093863 RepID=UPI00366EC4EA